MTMGSISGVSPTATDRANKKAENQLPLVSPQAANTMGVKMAIKRMSTQAMELAPWSKPFFKWASASEKPP